MCVKLRFINKKQIYVSNLDLSTKNKYMYQI